MIKLTISRSDNNDEESNLPSSLFPSSGLGHGWFQLEATGKKFPTHRELSWALQDWNDDCVLMEYDSTSGIGRFVIVDWYAPTVGTMIELEFRSFTSPNKLTREAFRRG